LVAVPQRHPVNEKARYVPGEQYRYLDLTHLNGEKLILAKPDQSIRQDADRFLAEKGVVPKKIRVISNIETAMQMVAEGLGIGFNREGYARHMKYTKGVNYYGIDSDKGRTDFVLAYRKDMPVMGYMQRMIDMLLERGKEYQR
ncbi:MAG: LysR family transcriptional regulator substrate-binding protein, partial [Clostridium sp.]|nr:LysR family transcriptional regulator substrate-binding protein [Clostridium sp.]